MVPHNIGQMCIIIRNRCVRELPSHIVSRFQLVSKEISLMEQRVLFVNKFIVIYYTTSDMER